jgi:hypothetical protein
MEDMDPEEPKDGEEPPLFADTAYNKEVLRITSDYLNLVKEQKTAKN